MSYKVITIGLIVDLSDKYISFSGEITNPKKVAEIKQQMEDFYNTYREKALR